MHAFLKLNSLPSLDSATLETLVLRQDDVPCQIDDIARTDQRYRLDLSTLAELIPAPTDVEIRFENEDLLVLNKPAHLLVHAAGGLFEWTLVDWARLHYPEDQIDLCHRLDRQTSGAVILTKHR